MAVSVDLTKVLDKEWEHKSLAEILAAPVSALAGVTEADAEYLSAAFGIKTVEDLGGEKHFAAAGALLALSRHAD